MARAARKFAAGHRPIEKEPTGIRGFDEVTLGGLPRGRTSLLAGGPGCGKTLFGIEFLARGALELGQPGVLMAFEENEAEIVQNAGSIGFDLERLIARNLLAIDFVRVERSEIEEAGEYDLEGLFVRLGYAIDQVGAKRVVLDTIETLFSTLPNPALLRSELRRLFRWLKAREVTAIVTAERGDGTLTRNGLEEYVSDCVVALDHRVAGQISTRRLRVVKYRGSAHGTNEYPFLIGNQGFSVLPITSLGLDHPASANRVSSGLPELDRMLGGGFLEGSSVLVSGTPGAGKSSLAAHFADGACARGERCIYYAFEESPDQIVRNMRSIGIDLGRWRERGLLRFHAARPQAHGLETHLAVMERDLTEFRPDTVVVDPLSNLEEVANLDETRAMVTRLIDLLKGRSITSLFTSLTENQTDPEHTPVGVSSLMDTWLLVRNLESNGERNRGLYILKSRGTAHSNQIREFRLTSRGAELLDVYRGPAGVLTGSARLVQESQDRAEADLRRQTAERRRRDLARKRALLEARIAALRAEFAADEHEQETVAREERDQDRALETTRDALGTLRATGVAATAGRSRPRPRSRKGQGRTPKGKRG